MLEIITLPLGEIKPFKNNAKEHPKAQIAQIRASIEAFSMNDPICIDENNTIIEGHGRVLALREMGAETVPCIRLTHLTEPQKRAYILAHNKLTLNTGFDTDTLLQEFDFLRDAEFDVQLTGFSDEELQELFNGKLDGEVTDDDFDVDKALEEAPFVQPGDLWQLGRHRLLCGDATKPNDTALLMNGKQANLCVTDPPYNCNIEGGTGLKIQNDKMSSAAFYEFLLSSFRNIYTNLADGGAFYCFHSDAEKANFYNAVVAAGFHYSSTCIWVKNSLVLGRADYQQMHEPVMYNFKDTAKHKWYSDRKQTTVWNFDRPTKSELHPTMKPLPLIAYPIGNSSAPNAIVLDPFGGSGSTLMVCEQMDRICHMMELDPKYASVIVTRAMSVIKPEDITCMRDGKIHQYDEIAKAGAHE
ncbi:methyltransferase [Clostridia bacterium]|nr:methyltransferase [Clostridia bacterium]